MRSATAGRGSTHSATAFAPYLSAHSGDETNVANSARVFSTWDFTRTDVSISIHHPKLCKWYEGFMIDAQLLERVRQLRREGRSPKEIARALGLPPAMVSPVIRQIAREISTEATVPSVVGCWISPGWHIGLGVEEFGDWPVPDDCGPGRGGIVGALVARRDRPGRVSVCGYLVDTWCLGVKNALGPRLMNDRRLPEFRESFFAAFDADPVQAPIELVRHLVWGTVEYAHELGFEPHHDLWAAAGHIEPLQGPSAIRFGKDGKPFYVEGPYDDAARNLRTLERLVGKDNFSFEMSVPLALLDIA